MTQLRSSNGLAAVAMEVDNMMLTERSIVIADDDAVLRSMLTEIFLECGWRVRSAGDGFASLQAITEELPAMLLSDLEMGGMSGYELLSIVRRRFPSIRVVAMSGAFSSSTVPAGIAADGFYAKGGSVATLLDIVAKVASSPLDATGGSDAPGWPARSLAASASDDGERPAACPHYISGFHFSRPHTRQQSRLVCPSCRNNGTELALYEARTSAGGV